MGCQRAPDSVQAWPPAGCAAVSLAWPAFMPGGRRAPRRPVWVGRPAARGMSHVRSHILTGRMSPASRTRAGSVEDPAPVRPAGRWPQGDRPNGVLEAQCQRVLVSEGGCSEWLDGCRRQNCRAHIFWRARR